MNVVCAIKSNVAITTQQLVAKIVLALDLGWSFVWKFGFGGAGGLDKSENINMLRDHRLLCTKCWQMFHCKFLSFASI